MKEDLIVKAAVEEIINQTFAVTEQYLAVHKVPFQDGRPVIARVDKDAGDGRAVVYFPLEGENYFLAVLVDTGPEVSVSWIWIEPGNQVELIVRSRELELEELIDYAGLKPTRTWKKGEPIISKIRNCRKYEDNGFFFEPNPERADTLEDKLAKLLSKLDSAKEKIICLSERAEIYINIAYYGYKADMSGWHLDKNTIKSLAQLNIEVYLDLYAGGPDLPSGPQL